MSTKTYYIFKNPLTCLIDMVLVINFTTVALTSKLWCRYIYKHTGVKERVFRTRNLLHYTKLLITSYLTTNLTSVNTRF
jgi:hypothetical protein